MIHNNLVFSELSDGSGDGNTGDPNGSGFGSGDFFFDLDDSAGEGDGVDELSSDTTPDSIVVLDD